MEKLKSISDIDTFVTKNPNSVVIIYEEGCPFCKQLIEDLKELEKNSGVKVYLLTADVGAPLIKRIGANGVPLTIAFKECDIIHIFDGYDESIKTMLEEDYADARPICRVDLSRVLFEETLLGEPLI